MNRSDIHRIVDAVGQVLSKDPSLALGLASGIRSDFSQAKRELAAMVEIMLARSEPAAQPATEGEVKP